MLLALYGSADHNILIVNNSSHPRAKPFIKWVGGKSKLLPQLEPLLPKSFNRYYEPFVGGGAMFFGISPQKAVINDLNPHLINLYTQVRDSLDALLLKTNELLDIYLELAEEAQNSFFLLIREEFNQRTDDDVWGAAMFIFLNKTCYNGVYRENASGKFNVPFGRRKSVTLHDLGNITRASESLQDTTIRNGSYIDALTDVSKGDFIYLDPPYVPLGKEAKSFTQYIGVNFNMDEHLRLCDLFEILDKKGCHVMMSNSHTPVVEDLYSKFKQSLVLADRAVNCKAQGRGKISELVITNY